MARFTAGRGHPFPAGTTVTAYEDQGQKPEGQPKGLPAATSTAVVGADGSLVFDDLSVGHRYYAVAQISGAWRWVAFKVTSEDLEETTADPTDPIFFDPFDYGAIADGDLHTLAEIYGTLAAAQADYPFVTALSQAVDWAALTHAAADAKEAVPGDNFNFLRGGGVVLLRPRTTFMTGADTLNLDGMRGVSLIGPPGSGGSGAAQPRIVYGGGAGAGPAISARSMHAPDFHGFHLDYSNNAFNGDLLDCRSTGPDPIYYNIARMTFGHITNQTPQSHIRTNNMIISRIAECVFLGGQHHIYLSSGYLVVVTIEDTTHTGNTGHAIWFNPTASVESTRIVRPCVEPHADASCGSIRFEAAGAYFGNVIDTPWFGDHSGSGTALQVGGIGGVEVRNYKNSGFGGGGIGTHVKVHGDTNGLYISGAFNGGTCIEGLGSGIQAVDLTNARLNPSGSPDLALKNPANFTAMNGRPRGGLTGPKQIDSAFFVEGTGSSLSDLLPNNVGGIALGYQLPLASALAAQIVYSAGGDLLIRPRTNEAGHFVSIGPNGETSFSADGLRTGKALALDENASPPAAIADGVVLFAKDNGSGKTQLMARFPGADVQVVIQP